MVSVLFTYQTFFTIVVVLLFGNTNGMAVRSDPQDTSIGKPQVKSAGRYFKMDFHIERGSNRSAHTIGVKNKNAMIRLPASGASKRSGEPFEAPLKNQETYYLTDLYIGSNNQKISVDLDTGSSDLWVVASNVSCTNNCQEFGTFSPSESTSYENLGEDFKITYGDGSYAKGTWASENFAFADIQGANVTGLHFGDVDDTTAGFGILGVGLKSLESSKTQYPNMPALLAEQGVISKNAYSLYLDSPDADYGSVIFGGVDNAKYTGSLSEFPVTFGSRYLSINLVSVSAASEKETVNQPALLDSGTTLTYLSSGAFDTLGKAFNGTYNSDIQAYVVDCEASKSLNATYTFDNDFTIEVPGENLVNALQYNNGSDSDQCFLGVFQSSDSMSILGDNFLRSAYVVYNLDNRTISMAPVKYTSESDITSL